MFDLRGGPPEQPLAISRPNFVALCDRLTVDDERAFEALWRTLGLSVDWTLAYATIDDSARRASQRGFLRLLERGEAYQHTAPTLWDVDFSTAVSHAELEERERPGAYHRVRFERLGAEGHVEIETTRPELLAACVALVAHPDDQRYQDLFGTTVITPLFSTTVPVVAHDLADPAKGSGIAMVCTFGDTTDVVWWRELGLPTRTIVGRDGRLEPVPWGDPGWESLYPDRASANYDELVGRTVRGAQARVAELLGEAGALVGEPRDHHTPGEVLRAGRPTARDRVLPPMVRAHLGSAGPLVGARRAAPVAPSPHGPALPVVGGGPEQRLEHQPSALLRGADPVWYPVDGGGAVDYDRPLVPTESRLPVDPSTDVPDGYREEQRGEPGGFVGDPDVMDTWATSSLTPQIAGRWEDDPDLFGRVFPMDLRPQGHDIIRTWLFTTVVRAELEMGSLPWSDVAISGWVLDPDRKKMSKSKGNVVTPLPLLESHGADSVRYWAAGGRPGTDTAVDEGQMKVGRRLAIKVLNASKFILGRFEGGTVPGPDSIVDPLDLHMLAQLRSVVDDATDALDDYEYTRALESVETFFWLFCDDYLELVKTRAYGRSGDAAVPPGTADDLAVSTETASRGRLGLGALGHSPAPRPVPPVRDRRGVVVVAAGFGARAAWPDRDRAGRGRRRRDHTGRPWLRRPGARCARVTAEVVGRRPAQKTAAKRSMRARVARLEVVDRAPRLRALQAARQDLVDAGGVDELVLVEGENPRVLVTLDDTA